MILINLKMQIRPEKMDEWLALADSYAKDVNAEEGCLFFQFARSLTDPNEFTTIEGFKGAGAGGAHGKNSHAKRFVETAPDLVAAQPQIIYIDTPHDGFGPMGEIQPRCPASGGMTGGPAGRDCRRSGPRTRSTARCRARGGRRGRARSRT